MSMQPDRARARLGTVLLGKYRLDRVLGTGGMAVVYKATHRNQAEFAVKVLHPELSLHEDIRTRFLREGYAANSVKHPGVVSVVDDDVAEDGAAFLVMELLDGVVCEELWQACNRQMPVDAACAVLLQLLDVLIAAHARGIVHRDIKPANLFVMRDGTAKVLDFGIARVRDTLAGSAHAAHVTGTGMLLGTPAFMAPEQALARAAEIGPPTDLWSVGATFFGLVSGAMVHEAETAPELLVKLATQPPRALLAVAPWVPAPIAAVVDRALTVSRSERWATALEMRDALLEAVGLALPTAPSRATLSTLVATVAPRSHTSEPPPVVVVGSGFTPAGRGLARAGAPSINGTAAAPPGFAASEPSSMPSSRSAPLPSLVSAGGLLHGSTNAPLAREEELAKGGRRRKHPGALLSLVLGATVLMVAGGFFVRTRVLAPSPQPEPMAIGPSVAPTATTALRAAPSTTVESFAHDPEAEPQPPDTAPTVATALVVPSPPKAPEGPATGTRDPGKKALGGAPGVPTGPPSGAATKRHAPAAGSSQGSSMAAPTHEAPRCSPNFFLDANGEKHFKPECF